MSRSVRRVPMDWQHPKSYQGRKRKLNFTSLFDGSGGAYRKEAEAFVKDCAAWDNGTHADLIGRPELKTEYPFFWEWGSPPPDPDMYMPDFPPEQCIGWQMYETTSEGTPLSPVMDSPESLARWLADNKASAFAGNSATYEEWLNMIRIGRAVSAVSYDGGRTMVSGVAALAAE